MIKFVQQLPKEEQTRIINKVFKGDYTTPTCPSCDIKMVKRIAKNNTNYKFYGCPNYPRCQQKFSQH
ncbi:MAG: topoisomerase DNA-binding C4 zinc finger domain-containing protein [Kiritimatiellae bacterium]|nr:topoisomerase DNA-binding C4 zinc finger domain-containing protein [Kiritimatiellia bacterium]